MRIYDGATMALLAARRGLVAQRLIWIQARNRSTGAVEAMGLCTGVDDYSGEIEGEARIYVAAGSLLQSEPITAAPGLAVRVHQLNLAAIAGEVEDLVKGYDTRFAPVEIHRALFDPATRRAVGAPHRVFRGLLNSIDFPRAEPGGSPACVIELVSETRALTRSLALKKSDESHAVRGGDRFRRYGDISGAVPVYWGEMRAEVEAVQAVEDATEIDYNLGP